MWKLLITKEFLLQFLRLSKDKQTFILDSLEYLRTTLDIDSKLEIDIIDEYEADARSSTPFPITYYADHENKKVYLICIEEKFVKTTGKQFMKSK